MAPRPRWWLWTLWGYAPTPTLYVELSHEPLDRVAHALAAHEGELARSAYIRALRARPESRRCSAQRPFSAGAPAPTRRRAEVLTELISDRSSGWPLAEPRRPTCRCCWPARVASDWTSANGSGPPVLGPPLGRGPFALARVERPSMTRATPWSSPRDS